MNKPRYLKNMKISRVAFVDSGANNTDFALFKSKEFKTTKTGEKKPMITLSEISKSLKLNISKMSPEEMDALQAVIEGGDMEAALKMLAELKGKYSEAAPCEMCKAVAGEPLEKKIEAALAKAKAMLEKQLTPKAQELLKASFDALTALVKELEAAKEPAVVEKILEDRAEISDADLDSVLSEAFKS